MIGALFTLCRPANVAIAAAAILLGAHMAGGFSPSAAGPGAAGVAARGGGLATTLVAALLIMCAGYAWNDVADVERDRVVHARRPIPSGRISLVAARRFALALAAAGAACALAAPPPARAILLGWLVLLLAYRALADRVPASKNVIAALLPASACFLGGLLGPAPSAALFPALFALLLSWIREAVKDLADREGDRSVGRPSWIDSLPPRAASAVVRAAIVALLLLIPAPAFLLGYGPAYLVVAAIGVGGTLLSVYAPLGAIDVSAARLRAMSVRLKGSMAAGLVALVLARLA